MTVEQEPLVLDAYRVPGQAPMAIEPASNARGWMRDTRERFAFLCLPLTMANESGWIIRLSHSLRVTWTGAGGSESMTVEIVDGSPPAPAASHFGHGILSFRIPYVFRTPEGYNLLVRGPANLPKDGVAPLEGLIETDWAPVSFTMNWQVTRPHHPVLFSAGEPICMIVPQRRGELEAFEPRVGDMDEDSDIAASFDAWQRQRNDQLKTALRSNTFKTDRFVDQLYMKGLRPDGTSAAVHERRRQLRPFE
ncbi:MAG TPA: DUF6065 family protein [Acidimicrobiales bacterium]